MANTFNDSSYVDFFVGTQSEYDALVQHDKEVEISGEGEKILKDGALYHITDDNGNAQGVVMLDGWPIGWKSGIQGLVGSQGAIGTQGDIGTQGFVGSQGAEGSQGAIGTQGVIGTQGLAGSQGAEGSQGAIGTQGDIGPQGPQGFRGSIGEQGSQGTIGTQGIEGPQGPQGFRGTQGDIGAQGVIGTQGYEGPVGPQGFVGTQGPVTVLTRTIDSFKGFFVKQTNKAVAWSNLFHNLHGELIVVGGNICCGKNGSKFMLTRSYLVMTSFCRNS